MVRQYDAMVKPRRFDIGDLVLKRVTLATRNPAYGKLGPNWEGSYRVKGYQLQEARILLFGSSRWTKARTSLEC